MSIHLMTKVWKFSRAKGSALLVLLSLADNANDQGYCWPSISTIASKARLERRHVNRVLKDLEQLGEIKIQHRFKNGRQTSNIYWLTLNRGDILSPLNEDGDIQTTMGGDFLTPRDDKMNTLGVTPESYKSSVKHQLNLQIEPLDFIEENCDNERIEIGEDLITPNFNIAKLGRCLNFFSSQIEDPDLLVKWERLYFRVISPKILTVICRNGEGEFLQEHLGKLLERHLQGLMPGGTIEFIHSEGVA